jgi:hypothetical protein
MIADDMGLGSIASSVGTALLDTAVNHAPDIIHWIKGMFTPTDDGGVI